MKALSIAACPNQAEITSPRGGGGGTCSARLRGSVVRSGVDQVFYYGTVNGCPVPVLKGLPRISRTLRYDH